MNFKALIHTILLILCGSLLFSTGAFAETSTPVYRLLNEATGEHLYTAFSTEADTLVFANGWKAEGDGWMSPLDGGEPVYRLFNPNSGEHLFSKDRNEVNTLASLGWQIDNDGNSVLFSGGTTPVYRLYDPVGERHFYTTDYSEYTNLSNMGWRGEGTVLYATEKGSLPNISNIPSEYAIEADVYLSGSGSGYHAKLVAGTDRSAVSFGLQYDTAAPDPFRSQTYYLFENIASNNPGGQVYTRAGIGVNGKSHHILMAISNGTCIGYVNGTEVGRVRNLELDHKKLDLKVEGSARLNGDGVDCTFNNIQLKNNGTYIPASMWNVQNQSTNPTIQVLSDDYIRTRNVRIKGFISGLKGYEDWDSAYERVSGVATFYKFGN